MRSSLENKTVLITREKKQAKEFSRKVKQVNGYPIEVPLLQITSKNDDNHEKILREITEFTWFFFTSINGVHFFFELLKSYGISRKVLVGKKIAAVGHKTEKSLKKYNYEADFIPTIYNAETMAKEFSQQHKTEGRFLLIRGNRSMNVLPEAFSKLRVSYTSLEVYETSLHMGMEQTLQTTLQNNKFDYVTFTSPSTIDAFIQMNGMTYIKPDEVLCVCIGTTTERAARKAGFKQILIPEQFTIDGMLDIMLKHAGREG